MKKHYVLNFHLFDGEGGEGSGNTASQSDSKQDVKNIQYGKFTGEGQTPGQVGSDKGGGADDLNAEWEALTGKGGKFHDLLGQRVSSAIQDRFKNQADYQGQIDKISDDLSPLFMNYGLKSGDFEGLSSALANDDSFFQAGAERAGLDVDQYRNNLRLQADSERLHQIEESYRQEQQRQAMFAQWEAESDILRQALPNFDLAYEIESNESFAKLITNGVDVATAFRATHAQDIDAGMAADASRRATQSVVNNIQQRQSRPMEGALNHTPAIQRKTDPSRLTDEDLDEINRRVANGETISF